MKVSMLVMIVGILSGVAMGLLVGFGFGQIAAGFFVVVIAGLLALLYWRVSSALAKLLTSTRSIRKSIDQLGGVEERLASLQGRVSNLESSANTSTTQIKGEINHEMRALKSELQRIDTKLHELVDASTRRIRNDLKTQNRDTNALIERNHRARLKESHQNSRLLTALEKQRDLLGTLVINSDFRFNNDGE